MKRTDIRAGVVYAIKSSYGPPVPVVFLEDAAAGLYGRGEYGRGPYRKLTEDKWTKARSGSGFSTPARGYAVMEFSRARDITYAAAAEAMCAIDPATELARFLADEKPSAEGLQFGIVTSLGQIAGLYDEERAVYEAAKEAEAAADRRKREADRAAFDRRLGITEALSAYGITARGNAAGKVELSPDEAEKLIALLRDRKG